MTFSWSPFLSATFSKDFPPQVGLTLNIKCFGSVHIFISHCLGWLAEHVVLCIGTTMTYGLCPACCPIELPCEPWLKLLLVYDHALKTRKGPFCHLKRANASNIKQPFGEPNYPLLEGHKKRRATLKEHRLRRAVILAIKGDLYRCIKE